MKKIKRLGLAMVSAILLSALVVPVAFAQEECGDFFTTRWNQTATDANLCELEEEVTLYGEGLNEEDLSHPVITVIIPTPTPTPPPPEDPPVPQETPVPDPTPTPEPEPEPEPPSEDPGSCYEKKAFLPATAAEPDPCAEVEVCNNSAALLPQDEADGKVKGPKGCPHHGPKHIDG